MLMRDTIVQRSSRRLFFGAALGVFALASLTPVAALAADDGDQAEWPQSYESSPQMQVQRESTPILSPATVDATQAAIQKYQEIVARGGWSSVPSGGELRIGPRGPRVQALRDRLVASASLRFDCRGRPR